ncbi:acyl-CoA synthetase (AMP-forming)/AMP-acid ligase II [Tamaricihabitans halophyticus]|uniref:Acyl-CoA synthetase (AMP-forming)/AMP-acid ligase II n=1 Tax=Tamaricihabitans halophyticus TaxID=1262583 RepID=A0A4R2Q917_9PSEU|nr:acyl-CoA synthetase [Tamaricihabitans halophyticus]TCP45377.1 acyl-CoA synthetase (AMP-forming)/AMP-acid ligase II [Tamaricihabitans halophyticus]
MALNIADLVEHAVDLMPDRLATRCGEASTTFAEFDERANRLAHYLAAQGVGPGEHVGVYARNRIEAVEAMLAAYKLRAVAININYRYTANELRYIFDNADLVALVHERRYADKVAAVLPEVPRLRTVLVLDDDAEPEYARYGAVDYETALADSRPDRDFPERSADDRYILYTGGTTGYPKGVVWRHEDVWRVLGGGIDFVTGEKVVDEWQQSQSGAQAPGLVRFPVPPLIHGAAQWAALQSLFTGGTVVFLPRFDAHEVWRTVQRYRVQVMLIVGDAMARPMIEALAEGGYDASSLLAIASSAALFSPSVKEQYLSTLENVVLTDSIGSSETGFSGLGMAQRGAAFTGGPRVRIDPDNIVIDERNRPIAAGSDTIGRIARGGNIPLGYYKDPAKTAELFTEIEGKRYAVPGDFAKVEDDGTVTMLGRGSTCVNTGGEKVFVEEVESALKAHPDVFDALVIGISDELLGQRVAAVVQPRPGARPALDTLDTHTRSRIAGYKVPRTYWFTDAVSRSPSGKPDYAWAQEYARNNPEVSWTEQAGTTG